MGRKLTPPPRTDAGFSLIELLIAIAVLSVLSVGAALVAGRSGGQPGEGADMARFRAQFATMRALAVQGRELRGLTVRGEGMRTARAGPDGWSTSEARQAWRGRVAFAPRGETVEPGAPDIRFLPNGRTSAFSIDFATGGGCESDGWRGLTCAAR